MWSTALEEKEERQKKIADLERILKVLVIVTISLSTALFVYHHLVSPDESKHFVQDIQLLESNLESWKEVTNSTVKNSKLSLNQLPSGQVEDQNKVIGGQLRVTQHNEGLMFEGNLYGLTAGAEHAIVLFAASKRADPKFESEKTVEELFSESYFEQRTIEKSLGMTIANIDGMATITYYLPSARLLEVLGHRVAVLASKQIEKKEMSGEEVLLSGVLYVGRGEDQERHYIPHS